MISVEQALAQICDSLAPLPAELVGLNEGLGRVLAEDLASRRTQPPFAVSAMDGYAVRACDAATVPVRLTVTGHVPAGARYDGAVEAGKAVRIFTGAGVPAGADAIVLQEDTEADGSSIVVREAPQVGRHIRAAGIDYFEGEACLIAGTRLTARGLGLAAGMSRPWLMVHRRPRVAILPTGNELVLPGDPVGPNQIVNSNGTALAALVAAAGGVPIQLGIGRDDVGALQRLANGGIGADLLVTIGGASVGEHDLVRSALGQVGLDVDFWKVAMRPGKPLMFGRFGSMPVLGLPGNPASALICALLFLLPALERLQGLPGNGPALEAALVMTDLPANERRQGYLRAKLELDADGRWRATPYAAKDSSLTSVLAAADALILRPPEAPAVPAGSPVRVIHLARLGAWV
jgi:molybdopterin molybdotransferase